MPIQPKTSEFVFLVFPLQNERICAKFCQKKWPQAPASGPRAPAPGTPPKSETQRFRLRRAFNTRETVLNKTQHISFARQTATPDPGRGRDVRAGGRRFGGGVQLLAESLRNLCRATNLGAGRIDSNRSLGGHAKPKTIVCKASDMPKR